MRRNAGFSRVGPAILNDIVAIAIIMAIDGKRLAAGSASGNEHQCPRLKSRSSLCESIEHANAAEDEVCSISGGRR